MRVIEQLPTYTAEQLDHIEGNAERWLSSGTAKQKADAKKLVVALTAERGTRERVADELRIRTGEIAERVRGMGLFDRAVMAFTERPATELEAGVLRAIAASPGKDDEFLARAARKGGGGQIKLVMDTLCAEREAYLGPVPKSGGPSDLRRSSLLIQFTRSVRPNGSSGHLWTLKAEAEAALRQVGVI